MSIAVSAALALQLAGAEPSIGVAAAAQDGRICVAMPAPALVPGTSVTLIRPEPPQSAFVAILERPVPACEPLERAMVPGPYYLVRRAAPAGHEAGSPWVALSGRLETRGVAADAIAFRLSPSRPSAQVRSCTSHEGVHLTVWAGSPLKSPRVWHQYYYLGFDVEPSCGEQDAGDLPRAGDRPDFSGAWILESEPRGGRVPQKLVVSQRLVRADARGRPMPPFFKEIAVTRVLDGRATSETHRIGVIGGSVAGDRNGIVPPQTRFGVAWEHRSLVFEAGTYTGHAPESGDWTERREVWDLDPDGKLRVTIRSRGSAHAPATVALVYRRR